MTDNIIDLTRYLSPEPDGDLPKGAMALWGAEGERSRFALPLWRIIYLAQAERGVIVSRANDGQEEALPFVALDLAQEPARTELTSELPDVSDERGAALLDLGSEGLVVHLGERAGRTWCLVVDGGAGRSEPLPPRAREDILFLAGECAGLLFLRDLADEAETAEEAGNEAARDEGPEAP